MGADALEFDVRLSQDGEVVVMHDPDLGRTTSGTGAVALMTLPELRALDAGYRFTRDGGRTFPWRGRGLTIPMLDEVFESFPGIPLLIEVKTAAASEGTELTIRRHNAVRRVVVGSFEHAALARFRGGDIAHGASRRDVVALYARAALPGGPRRVPYQALCIPPQSGALPLPVLRFARMLRPLGVPVHVWTVDDPAQAMRYWHGGVSGIISNDPAVVLTAAGRAAPPPHSPTMVS